MAQTSRVTTVIAASRPRLRANAMKWSRCGTGYFQRLVIAVREYVGEFGPKLEQTPCPGQLQMPARPLLGQPAPIRLLQRAEPACAFGKIDRPPVVGIDQ